MAGIDCSRISQRPEKPDRAHIPVIFLAAPRRPRVYQLNEEFLVLVEEATLHKKTLLWGPFCEIVTAPLAPTLLVLKADRTGCHFHTSTKEFSSTYMGDKRPSW
jgi:hypothetical protein